MTTNSVMSGKDTAWQNSLFWNLVNLETCDAKIREILQM